MTEKEIARFSKALPHISIEEMEQDVKDTQEEIDQFEKELEVLQKNPVDNKLKIFFTEGKISIRKDFINDVTLLVEYRKSQL